MGPMGTKATGRNEVRWNAFGVNKRKKNLTPEKQTLHRRARPSSWLLGTPNKKEKPFFVVTKELFWRAPTRESEDSAKKTELGNNRVTNKSPQDTNPIREQASRASGNQTWRGAHFRARIRGPFRADGQVEGKESLIQT